MSNNVNDTNKPSGFKGFSKSIEPKANGNTQPKPDDTPKPADDANKKS